MLILGICGLISLSVLSKKEVNNKTSKDSHYITITKTEYDGLLNKIKMLEEMVKDRN